MFKKMRVYAYAESSCLTVEPVLSKLQAERFNQ